MKLLSHLLRSAVIAALLVGIGLVPQPRALADAPSYLVLNELKVDPPGTDQPWEYVEFRGTPGSTIEPNTYFIVVEGDIGGGAGTVDLVVDLSGITLDPTDGLLVLKAATGGHTIPAGVPVITTTVLDAGGTSPLENGTSSFLVITTTSVITKGVDYDISDLGVLAITDLNILDAVGWTDGGATDIVYGGVLLNAPTGADAATRFLGNNTAISETAWYYGTLSGADASALTYGTVSANFPLGGILTPGAQNVPLPPPPNPCEGPYTQIYDIQGSGATSPLSGTVASTKGVVVGDFEGASPNLRGFYIQAAVGDGISTTSDGIFVFNAGADQVSAGDLVSVTGTVQEVQGQTQLGSSPVVAVCPDPPVITPTDITLPVPEAVGGVDYLERYQGMLVRLPQTLYVTEHFQLGRFGMVVMSSGDRQYNPTHLAPPGAPAIAQQNANRLNRIIIDDRLNTQNADPIVFGRNGIPLSATNTLRTGDTATGITGTLTYGWAGNSASPNNWRVRPLGSPDFQPANARPTAPAVVSGTLRVASFNVLNYFNTFGSTACTLGVGGAATGCRGANNATEFDRQWTKIVSAMHSINADVVGLMEIENDGYTETSAIHDLVTKLNDIAGSGTYTYVNADAEVGGVNVLGTDAIKVGILYKPAAVTPLGVAALSTGALGDYVTGSGITSRNRPVLAVTFAQNTNSQRFTVAVNHLKSKGSSCADNISPVPSDPDLGDGQGNCNLTRLAAAQELTAWLQTNPTGYPDPDILIMGDLNSYRMEDPITAIKNAGYTDLVDTYLGNTTYGYVFDGQAGYLDHALATTSLANQTVEVIQWHINADEPSTLDYNTEFKSAGQLVSLYSPDLYRASDHDPVVIGLNLHTILYMPVIMHVP